MHKRNRNIVQGADASTSHSGYEHIMPIRSLSQNFLCSRISQPSETEVHSINPENLL